MSDQTHYTIAPGNGSQLIFVTEDRPIIGRDAVWLVPHSEESPTGRMTGLTERDLTTLKAFLAHAQHRVAEALHQRHMERTAATRDSEVC